MYICFRRHNWRHQSPPPRGPAQPLPFLAHNIRPCQQPAWVTLAPAASLPNTKPIRTQESIGRLQDSVLLEGDLRLKSKVDLSRTENSPSCLLEACFLAGKRRWVCPKLSEECTNSAAPWFRAWHRDQSQSISHPFRAGLKSFREN